MANYNPGAAVTVGDLTVGDVVFLRERTNGAGSPVPTTPATVTELVPSSAGRIQVRVRAAASDSAATTRLLGQLPVTREFRRAVPVA
jgi:hypothetical protein